MKQFISFSGGIESTTMCVLFGNEADAIFADTGFEHKLIYDRIDLVEKWVQNFHRKDFKIHRIKSKYGTLPNRIREIAFYPSFTTRYCTREMKIQPIDTFLNIYKGEGCRLMIGLNYNEQNRINKRQFNQSFIDYFYPLAVNKLSRESCVIILKKADLFPNFPVYMRRGGCIGCFYKQECEYEAMAILSPEEFKIVEDLEIELQTLNKEGYHGRKKGKPGLL